MVMTVPAAIRFRVSLAVLMLLVGFAAVAFAALRHPTETWAGVLLLAMLGMLAVAVLGVISREGSRRAWWLGFVLFGSGYLALAFAPWTRPRLPTTALLVRLQARFQQFVLPGEALRITATRTGAVRVVSEMGWTLEASEISLSGDALRISSYGSTMISNPAPSRHFLDVGHCLLAWPAALVGALAARWFHATRKLAEKNASGGGTPT
jgi:hypothetical protein